MKYLLIVTYLLFYIPLKAQDIKTLDNKYGFKQFKFGMAPAQIKNIKKLAKPAFKNPNITEYVYDGNELNYLYEVKVEEISLTFYKNKLCMIEINFGSLNKEYLDSEYAIVQYSLEELFGNENYNASNESGKIIKGCIWKGNRVTLEHIKINLSSGKDDNNNHIFGYINLYENNIKKQWIADDF